MFAFLVKLSVIFEFELKFTLLLVVLLRVLVKSTGFEEDEPAVTTSSCAFVSDTGPAALAAPASASTEMPAISESIFDIAKPPPFPEAIPRLRSARLDLDGQAACPGNRSLRTKLPSCAFVTYQN